MSTIIECAFVNSVISTECDCDRNSYRRAGNTAVESCAQQGITEKRISGLRMLWLSRSAARDECEYVDPEPDHFYLHTEDSGLIKRCRSHRRT